VQRDIDGVGVAAEIVTRFIQGDLRLPAQLVRDGKAGDAGADDGDLHGRPPLAGAWNKSVAKRPETNKRGREEKRFRRSIRTQGPERLRNVKTVRNLMHPCNRQNGVIPPKFQPRV
jgi:hypothetical protein